MLQVRKIGLIAFIGLSWGLTPTVSCIKSGDGPAPVTPPAADPVQSPTTDTTSLPYLALGDSYTIGESVAVADRYPVQAVRLLSNAGIRFEAPEIIARTGWATDDLLDALRNKTAPVPYEVVSLLIGVNNQYQGGSQAVYRQQFTSLLEQSIQLAGNRPSHVIVLSIPDYSVTPFARGSDTARISSQIDSFNTINYEVSLAYQVHYVDITADSRKAANDPSLIASDGLHFSGEEYGIWANKMLPVMEGIVKNSVIKKGMATTERKIP